MKVLISQDEEILLTAIEFRLRKHGFDVLIAKDGKQALEIINNEAVDIVIADLEMSKLSGLELVKTLRKEKRSNLPIIVIGALENGDNLLEALHKGANDFVTKPFKPVELILRIRKILNSK